ncbi:MAG: phosphopyruvate hydratase [Candidatus Paceibacterota bacterium]|jgi:enolase
MSKITKLSAKKILDSRGEWTIEVGLELDGKFQVQAAVPQGKSVGSHEAVDLPDDQAVVAVEKIIASSLIGRDFTTQRQLDDELIKLDGTKNKSKLGADSLLGISMAFCRAMALAGGLPLWKHISNQFSFTPNLQTRLFVNVINGGKHAGNNLDFQEYLLIPKAGNMADSVDMAKLMYKKLGEILAKRFGDEVLNVGDEGGYAPDCKDNVQPFEFLHESISVCGYQDKVDVGVDVAASSFSKKPADLVAIYKEIKSRWPNFIYLEDPFGEDDFASFSSVTADMGGDVLITGDDLTVTNVEKIKEAVEKKSANAVIIKPNQIGTITEAADAVAFAKESGWQVVASHRSGETNDDFIADFAVGVGAFGLKLGSPARGERVAKYNRLIEISKEDRLLGSSASK